MNLFLFNEDIVRRLEVFSVLLQTYRDTAEAFIAILYIRHSRSRFSTKLGSPLSTKTSPTKLPILKGAPWNLIILKNRFRQMMS